MESNRSYRRRGTPELPMSTYLIRAGVDMYLSTHYHPEIQLDLVVSGNMTMQIGSTAQSFSEGDIYIIPANTVHGLRGFTENASIRRLMFLPEAIHMLPEHFFSAGVCHAPGGRAPCAAVGSDPGASGLRSCPQPDA